MFASTEETPLFADGGTRFDLPNTPSSASTIESVVITVVPTIDWVRGASNWTDAWLLENARLPPRVPVKVIPPPSGDVWITSRMNPDETAARAAAVVPVVSNSPRLAWVVGGAVT